MEYEWKRTRRLGPIREGQFDTFWITGWAQSIDDDEGHGWYIQSKPAGQDRPLHECWVAGGVFKSIRQVDNRMLIGEMLVAVNSGEASAINKAIDQWEYEGIENPKQK